MPSKSRSKSARGEFVGPPRKSARISRIIEEKQSRRPKTAQDRTPAKEVRKHKSATVISKVPTKDVQQNKVKPAKPAKPAKPVKPVKPVNIRARKSTQPRKGISSKKSNRATPITAVGGKAAIGQRNYSAARSDVNARLEHDQSEPLALESSDQFDIPPEIVEFYHSRGYEVPNEASMAFAANGGTASSQVSSTKPKKPKGYGVDSGNPRYTAVLLEHNISILPCDDPGIEYYRELALGDDLELSGTLSEIEREIHRREDTLWKEDILGCKRSNEARFQRTVMMTILNRQVLDQNLDFFCETQWISERVCQDCIPKLCKINQPKPDLAIAFRSKSLLPANSYLGDFERLKIWHKDIFPEGFQDFRIERAFPFFSMEVKGKRGQIDNHHAELQNVNTASQALLNIYRCMKRVDDLDTFFEKVRVFSAVATMQGLWLRVHRGVRLGEASIVNQDFPIGFEFDDLEEFSGKYTRTQATNIVYNILYKYGVQKLHHILKKTMNELLKQYPRVRSKHSLQDLQQAAASQETQAEVNPQPASQDSSSRKRRAQGLEDSFTSNISNSRRRLDRTNINDSQESEVSVEG